MSLAILSILSHANKRALTLDYFYPFIQTNKQKQRSAEMFCMLKGDPLMPLIPISVDKKECKENALSNN